MGIKHWPDWDIAIQHHCLQCLPLVHSSQSIFLRTILNSLCNWPGKVNYFMTTSISYLALSFVGTALVLSNISELQIQKMIYQEMSKKKFYETLYKRLGRVK